MKKIKPTIILLCLSITSQLLLSCGKGEIEVEIDYQNRKIDKRDDGGSNKESENRRMIQLMNCPAINEQGEKLCSLNEVERIIVKAEVIQDLSDGKCELEESWNIAPDLNSIEVDNGCEASFEIETVPKNDIKTRVPMIEEVKIFSQKENDIKVNDYLEIEELNESVLKNSMDGVLIKISVDTFLLKFLNFDPSFSEKKIYQLDSSYMVLKKSKICNGRKCEGDISITRKKIRGRNVSYLFIPVKENENIKQLYNRIVEVIEKT